MDIHTKFYIERLAENFRKKYIEETGRQIDMRSDDMSDVIKFYGGKIEYDNIYNGLYKLKFYIQHTNERSYQFKIIIDKKLRDSLIVTDEVGNVSYSRWNLYILELLYFAAENSEKIAISKEEEIIYPDPELVVDSLFYSSVIIDDNLYEILEISKKIYEIQENSNPSAIFRDKVFLIDYDNNNKEETIHVRHDCENKDNRYFFETSDIEGVIIKKQNNEYCIKASVRYINSDNKDTWFAKIRVESLSGNIEIKGTWGGSWQQADYHDEDITTNNSSDLPLALHAMRNHLYNIYNELSNNKSNSDLYDHGMIKKLKQYNK